MNLKKLITFIILAVFCLVSLVPVNVAADTDEDIQTKADALNAIGILQGNNGDYYLSNSLKRSEAVTFITRLLGKEDYVKENAEQYQTSSFPDVSEGAWYAPYVGFCVEEGLIAGDTAGYFNPDAYITEKAFLKILLCALGYTYGTDFDWTDVYRKAWDNGIVREDTYITRTQDEVNYKRAEVVKALYNMLSLKKNGSDSTLIQDLINDGAVSRDTALESGILNDSLPMEIDIITLTGENKILVNLNENVSDVTEDKISIYETDNPSIKPAIGDLAINADKIEIEVSGLKPLKEYTVELTDVTDQDGNLSGQISNTFKTPEISSDFFKIKNVEAVAENQINVYFTHPVNVNSELPASYTIVAEDDSFDISGSQYLSVKKLQSVDNCVSILLKSDKLAKDGLYTLKISGKLTSLYGVRLNEGKESSYEFAGTSEEEDEFDIKKVSALDSNSLSVELTKEMDPDFFVQKAINYTVTGPDDEEIAINRAVVAGEGDKQGKIILLDLDKVLDKGEKYVFKAEFIADIFRQDILEGAEYSFTASYSTSKPKLVGSVGSTDKDYVYVKFNKAMDLESVTDVDNYSIIGSGSESFYETPKKVYYEDAAGQHIARLYLQEGVLFKSSGKYKLQISDTIKDALGEEQMSDTEYSFSGGSGNVQKPYITDAVAISKDAIKITLSKDIAADLPNLLSTNYTLEYTEDDETVRLSPIGITYIDSKTLVLRFDEFDLSAGGTLKFLSLKDYSGEYIRTAADGKNTIEIKPGN